MMKALITRVNEMFAQYNIALEATEKTELESVHQLEDGTEVRADLDNIEEGAQLYIINDEGERIVLPEGQYKFKDGSVVAVGANGAVKSVSKGGDGKEGKVGVDGKPVKSNKPENSNDGGSAGGSSGAPSKGKPSSGKTKPPPKTKKSSQKTDMEEQEEKGNYVTREEVQEMIMTALEEMMPKEEEQEMQADAEAEVEVEVEVEASEENSVETEMAQLRAELSELRKTAAEGGVTRQVAPKHVEPVDLSKLELADRVAAIQNMYS